jgi:hypothetical protein
VPDNGLAAAPVELGDPERLDLALVPQPQLALDLQLDRQPVAVPAALAVDLVAAHRLEPRPQVLERTGLHVVYAGGAVRGRRALVEDVRRAARALLQRPGEHVTRAPQREDLAVDRRQVERMLELTKAHGRSSLDVRSGSPGGCRPGVA